MSLEERVTQLEENAEELTKPKTECIFCHEPMYGQKTSESYKTAFDFVKQAFKKDGVIGCNHDKLKEVSIWFADFVYGSLLHEMIANYNRDQFNLEVNQQVLSNYSVMEKAFDRYVIEITEITDKVVNSCAPEEKEYWEYKRSLIPIFCEHAKKLYEVTQ